MKEQVEWHELLGTMFKRQLTPYNVGVYTEVPTLNAPPRSDVLLLRREGNRWTTDQLRYLPDGIRESNASHILIEFKATESLTPSGVRRAAIYDDFYRASQYLSAEDVHTVLISSRKPRKKTLELFQFEATMQAGIYICKNILADRLTLISLNELESEPHNAAIQFFASHHKSRMQALATLRGEGFENVPTDLLSLLINVVDLKSEQKVTEMFATIKSDDPIYKSDAWFDLLVAAMPPHELAKRVHLPEFLEYLAADERLNKPYMKHVLAGMNLEQRLAGLEPEERLAGLEPEERLAGLGPEERLAGLGPEERLAGLEPEERLAGLEPEERLAGLGPEERLAGLEPEERLAGLEPEVIEAYLRNLKAKTENSAE